ncbi:hypothetical protein CXG81DRAFT_18828 [Caulochytrium protostelioides]|uniref:NDT80 domain-containing protein n=1 Tax=Caulochytrium protostelioides TaxID=1555241 RepID=A0A4P9X7X2_9FUNG|nr:hypothetical protein CXG81DRAFT_18828 [Caulochytrium protostelioides]|eukprot:RKP01353.1 hypothetical protein CXG81DRAFT_18828 [Caulochytrium protostelioides]
MGRRTQPAPPRSATSMRQQAARAAAAAAVAASIPDLIASAAAAATATPPSAPTAILSPATGIPTPKPTISPVLTATATGGTLEAPRTEGSRITRAEMPRICLSTDPDRPTSHQLVLLDDDGDDDGGDDSTLTQDVAGRDDVGDVGHSHAGANAVRGDTHVIQGRASNKPPSYQPVEVAMDARLQGVLEESDNGLYIAYRNNKYHFAAALQLLDAHGRLIPEAAWPRLRVRERPASPEPGGPSATSPSLRPLTLPLVVHIELRSFRRPYLTTSHLLHVGDPTRNKKLLKPVQPMTLWPNGVLPSGQVDFVRLQPPTRHQPTLCTQPHLRFGKATNHNSPNNDRPMQEVFTFGIRLATHASPPAANCGEEPTASHLMPIAATQSRGFIVRGRSRNAYKASTPLTPGSVEATDAGRASTPVPPPPPPPPSIPARCASAPLQEPVPTYAHAFATPLADAMAGFATHAGDAADSADAAVDADADAVAAATAAELAAALQPFVAMGYAGQSQLAPQPFVMPDAFIHSLWLNPTWNPTSTSTPTPLGLPAVGGSLPATPVPAGGAVDGDGQAATPLGSETDAATMGLLPAPPPEPPALLTPPPPLSLLSLLTTPPPPPPPPPQTTSATPQDTPYTMPTLNDLGALSWLESIGIDGSFGTLDLPEP